MWYLLSPNRRRVLSFGVWGVVTSAIVPQLRAGERRHPTVASFGRAKRCLLLFLTGGPPQLDTFDLKPNAPVEVRGELKPIPTNVPGIQFGELCPRLARHADKLCVVRSVTHSDTVHTSAGYTMLTGVDHPLANARTATDIRPNANDHPHLGALLAKLRPPRDGLPPFVSLPEVIKDAAVNEFPGLNSGFLGKPFDPLLVEADADKGGFRLPDIVLPADVTADRLGERRLLLSRLDKVLAEIDQQGELDGLRGRGFDLIRSAAVHRALQLDREPDRLRSAYGSHLFGQGCLLGRRLIEAGVPLVSVYWHYEGPDDSPVWDTHENNFPHLRNRLMPPTDQAVSALLEDMSLRGLLDDTLVICMGEFGRTPRVNKKGGRDHWPHAQTILLAGAGVPAGSVYGSSDRIGAYPASNPVSPADLMATFLHLLGVPADGEVRDRTGRILRVCHGVPIRGLIA